MENLTSKLLVLSNGKKYYILRQAAYKGNAYYFVAGVTEDGEDFTEEFTFLTKVPTEDGSFKVESVKDQNLLKLLASNIKLDDE